MADETTQTGEETSWWAFDAFADSELPSTPFDEPLEWPQTLDWEDFSGGADRALRFPEFDDLAPEPIFPPASAPEPEPPPSLPDPPRQAAGDNGDHTMPHVTVLAGLGGGATPSPPAADADLGAYERLPDSLWAAAPQAGNSGAPLVTTTIAAPTFQAPPDGGPGSRRRRFELQHGNAAIIALISFVSLVLLGMFMSVRARNNLPESQTRTTNDPISVQVPLNTIPLTTTVTTVPPPAAINIADLIPPPEETTTTAGSGDFGGSAGTSATTAAPARSTPAGGSTGTTQPAAQPTNTTTAPQTTTPPETTTPATSPPADQTTTPTTPRRAPPTFPSLSTSVPDNTGPTFTIPSIPGFPGFGG